jgi:hypothetical protein
MNPGAAELARDIAILIERVDRLDRFYCTRGAQGLQTASLNDVAEHSSSSHGNLRSPRSTSEQRAANAATE